MELFSVLALFDIFSTLRFAEVGYGVGAVVATIHDVLMTIGIFVLNGEMGLFVSGQLPPHLGCDSDDRWLFDQ